MTSKIIQISTGSKTLIKTKTTLTPENYYLFKHFKVCYNFRLTKSKC